MTTEEEEEQEEEGKMIKIGRYFAATTDEKSKTTHNVLLLHV